MKNTDIYLTPAEFDKCHGHLGYVMPDEYLPASESDCPLVSSFIKGKPYIASKKGGLRGVYAVRKDDYRLPPSVQVLKIHGNGAYPLPTKRI